MQQIRVVSAAERQTALPVTPGIHREFAVHEAGIFAGCACTEPGGRSDWHHHGDWHTIVYISEGRMRLEFGAEGHFVTARKGDFLQIPRNVIHREINDGVEPQRLIVFRAGSGPLTINVESPTDTVPGVHS